jgi:hypothetical protein
MCKPHLFGFLSLSQSSCVKVLDHPSSLFVAEVFKGGKMLYNLRRERRQLSLEPSVKPNQKPIPIGFANTENRPAVGFSKGWFWFSRFWLVFSNIGQFWSFLTVCKVVFK